VKANKPGEESLQEGGDGAGDTGKAAEEKRRESGERLDLLALYAGNDFRG